MIRIDESIIFFETERRSIVNFTMGGVHHYNITYVYVT